MALQWGTWRSYNVPYYLDICNISGYPAVIAKQGPEQSYQLAPRAKIFRRGAGKVETLQDVQTFIR